MGLTKTLEDCYPSIYKDADGNPTLDYGVSCGDGWLPLLDTLSALIVARANKCGLRVQVRQVKEKFGGLRFFLTGHDNFTVGLVDAAESMSLRSCEQCGKPGRMHPGPWLRTLCREHFDEVNHQFMLRVERDEDDEIDDDCLPCFDQAAEADEVRFHIYEGEPADEAAERRAGFDRMLKALQKRP